MTTFDVFLSHAWVDQLVVALWTGGREDDAVALAQETVRLAEAAGGHPDLESWRAFLVRATGG